MTEEASSIKINYQIQSIRFDETFWSPVYESCQFSHNNDGCFEDRDDAIRILNSQITKIKGYKYRVVLVIIEEKIKVEQIYEV